jgi:PAS domain S-box-containing protein
MAVHLEVEPGRPLRESYVDFVFQVIRNPDGVVEGILVHGVDVTERKRAETRLRASEQRYRSLFESMDQGYCVVEILYDDEGRPTDYRFLEVNPAFERQTGLRDARGRRVRELAPDHEEAWFEIYGRVAETGSPVRFEHEARALGGRWFDVFAFRLGDEAHSPRVAILFTDITERRRSEQTRERLVERLQEEDQRKNEFLAMLAHELRNPLAGIHSAIRLVHRPGLEEQVPYAHEVIERQSGNLSRLIDDLLDVSRITQGKVELKREIVDVTGIMSRAAEAVRGLVEQKRHELTIQITAGLLHVDADPTRLEQVFTNLLTNAAKYTPEGGRITFSAGRRRSEVVIAVKDTGVGIPAEMLPKVFDLFTQVDRTLARSEGGLGIGLTLVRQLVELHGGTVQAASTPGRGSDFTIRLPAQQAKPEIARPTQAPVVSGRGRRVLIVDDNADTARLTARLLQSMDFVVNVVHEGRAVLEEVRRNPPRVVLLDIGLPGMNGYEVARLLRQEECCRGAVIIAVSGYGDETAREQGRAAGFDHHLVKPVDIEEILRLVADEVTPETDEMS